MIATWSGWIASLPVKPSRAAASASGSQALLVLEVGEDAVDRLHAGGDRAGQAQRARQFVGEGSIRRRRHIWMRRRAPPTNPPRPSSSPPAATSGRGSEACRTGWPAVSVTIAWIGILPVRWASSATSAPPSALGRTMPSKSAMPSNPRSVLDGARCRSGLIAHPPLRAAGRARQVLQDLARRRLLGRGDAVLEVEDDGVGVAVERLGDLLLAVGGDEQPAARLGSLRLSSAAARCGCIRRPARRAG